jgi:hypothetical protein
VFLLLTNHISSFVDAVFILTGLLLNPSRKVFSGRIKNSLVFELHAPLLMVHVLPVECDDGLMHCALMMPLCVDLFFIH